MKQSIDIPDRNFDIPKQGEKHGSSSLLYLCMQMIANTRLFCLFLVLTFGPGAECEELNCFVNGFDVRHN